MSTEPIRILHIVTYMGRGGLETMLMNYYRKINRDKVQFDFLVHRDFEADYDKEILALGGKIYHLPNLNPFGKKYLNALNEFFETHKEYKIVHSHLDCMAGIPLKYAKKHGVPVRIAHAHSSNQTKDKKYILKLLFKRNITRYANQFFACGTEAGKWMFGIDDFMVLNNAIDAKEYIHNPVVEENIRVEIGLEKEDFVIGHVGRFAPPKNHAFLIDVFYELSKKEEKAKLLLVGDGELRNLVENKVKELGLENKVIFAGLRSDVPMLLQAMNVFMFPSIYEGLPVSIVEAQAAGLPCLISEKVPIECKKTELVEQLSLEEGAGKWAEKIRVCKERERVNTYEQLKKAKFDIEENSKWLEHFYLDICNMEKL